MIAGITSSLIFGLTALQPAPLDDRNNAAWWYQRTIEQYESMRNLELEDRTMLFLTEPGDSVPEDVSQYLATLQPVFERMQQGSIKEHSNFDLNFAQGIDLKLPHLSPMRRIAYLMNADALASVTQGDSSRAAERLADAYRMSSHLQYDGVVISTLVGQSIFEQTDRVVSLIVDRAALSPQEGAVLLNELTHFSRNDPFGYAEALASEHEWMLTDLQHQFFQDGKYKEEIEGILATFIYKGSPLEAFAAMSPDVLENELRVYDEMMSRVVEAFFQQDAVVAKELIDQIKVEIESGELCLLCGLFIPSPSKLLERKNKAVELLNNRINVLVELSGEDARPIELANAAVWYLQGIELLDDLEESRRDIVLKFADGIPVKPSDDVDATLRDAEAAIDLFRKGSQARLCRFDADDSRHAPAPHLIQQHGIGMHDALRFLRADAMRLFQSGDVDEGIERLVLSTRMIAHLNQDPTLASALIAHGNFNEIVSLLSNVGSTLVVTDTHRSQLEDAFGKISRRDPFGYIAAIINTRKQFAEFVERKFRGEEKEIREAVSLSTNRWEGDDVFYALVILDTLIRADESHETMSLEPIPQLTDILSIEEIDTARDTVHLIAPQLALGNWDLAAISDQTCITEVSRKMRRVRSDLRHAMHVLRSSSRE